MLVLVRNFSYIPNVSFSVRVSLTLLMPVLVVSFILLMLVLVTDFSYTPDGSFSENFPYTPGANFSQEFLLHY